MLNDTIVTRALTLTPAQEDQYRQITDFYAKHRDGNYDPFVPFEFDTPKFIIKTANHPEELRQAFRLRLEVFFDEEGIPIEDNQLDMDRFDPGCDHLIIIDKKSNRVIGNYRLRSTRFQKDFYSESEFDLKGFFASTDRPMLEMGRAIIHPAHRRGIVIHMIWRGLVEYMKQTETELLFGCSSLPDSDPAAIASIYESLKSRGRFDESMAVLPFQPYFNEERPYKPKKSQEDPKLPSLIEFYLKTGARILGLPFHDPEFRCADLFTLLDLADLGENYIRRYRLKD